MDAVTIGKKDCELKQLLGLQNSNLLEIYKRVCCKVIYLSVQRAWFLISIGSKQLDKWISH